MSAAGAWAAGLVGLVCVLTLLGGAYGLRLSRTTSDFYVAGRTVTPWWNASAIGGEYLSAASFLGVAGLVYAGGVDMLWFPVGYTLGYLVLLALVAAPLRRSGAYTAPDFAQARLGSLPVRRLASVFAVVIGWAYLLPQLYGAGLALRSLTGAPSWVGAALVAVVVTLNVVAGGMRSVTLVQAVQYWVKLIALAVPALVLLGVWLASGTPTPHLPTPADVGLDGAGGAVGDRAYTILSTLLALCLGTMGLPHVVVRFYTNPDGRAARRTTVRVVALLGLFYVFPPLYALLARVYVPQLPPGVSSDAIVLLLPSAVVPGGLGTALTAVLAAGAFAALLSTASGLAVAVAGVLDQDVVRPALLAVTGGDATGIQSFRLAAGVAMVVPCAVLPLVDDIGLATSVTLVFAVAASTFSPLLVLGVWWRGLTAPGAAAGMVVGGVSSLTALGLRLTEAVPAGEDRLGLFVASPAAWTVTAAFVTAILVSLATPERVPRGSLAMLARLHTPERVDLARLRP
ncbi:sodium/solute symporter [Agilicoccus flavus]|uniref:sodium/solute symporter n=1 Tax=Agilicoccus flavus TaxID=2775968 RepID=UPI001CF70FC2|nr:cation acetate symporter [Agilicoccus flavus]